MRTDQMPAGVTWRPATLDDVEAIVRLQDACFAVDRGYREVADEVAERFESPMLNPEADALLGLDVAGDVVVSIWNHILPNPEEAWQVYDDNYIHPSLRTEEMRDAVLDWWIERAHQRTADDERQLPLEFHQHIYPETEQETAAFIEGRGFSPSIYFQELRRDLSLPIPEPRVPGGLDLVSTEDVDRLALLEARNDAFRDHRGSQAWPADMWNQRMEASTRAPTAEFAVVDSDRPVAYTLCATFPHDWDDLGYSEGWIEGVGTVRSHRGRGLASAVITASMRALADEGLQYATLGVDSENPSGAVGLYTKLGFEPVRMYVDYTLTIPQGEQPDG